MSDVTAKRFGVALQNTSNAYKNGLLIFCKDFSPVCPPACRSSWPLQSPAWWHQWCQSGLVRRNGPFSCWAGSSRLCGASPRSAPLSQALDVWSPWFPGSRGHRPWRCPGKGARGRMPLRPWRSPTSWGSRFLCNPTFCTLRWSCTHSCHLLRLGRRKGEQGGITCAKLDEL